MQKRRPCQNQQPNPCLAKTFEVLPSKPQATKIQPRPRGPCLDEIYRPQTDIPTNHARFQPNLMLRCFGIMGVYLLTSFNRFLKPSHGILPWSCLLRWWLLPKRQLTQQTTEPSGGAHTVTWEFVDFWTAYRTIGNKCHLMPTPLLQSRSHSGTSKAKTCDGVNTGNLDSMKRETFKL